MEQKKVIRVKVLPCEVYSRVVGYYTPVINWNDGKKQEFLERKTIKINDAFKSFNEFLNNKKFDKLDK